MNRNAILKIINPLIAILIVNQVVVALLHDSISHELFEILHEAGGFVFAGLILVHIILNWGWFKSAYRKNK